MLLWRAAVRDDRLKPTAVCGRDVHDNVCSHTEASKSGLPMFGNKFGE
jgi:hypothetical protein